MTPMNADPNVTALLERYERMEAILEEARNKAVPVEDYAKHSRWIDEMGKKLVMIRNQLGYEGIACETFERYLRMKAIINHEPGKAVPVTATELAMINKEMDLEIARQRAYAENELDPPRRPLYMDLNIDPVGSRMGIPYKVADKNHELEVIQRMSEECRRLRAAGEIKS